MSERQYAIKSSLFEGHVKVVTPCRSRAGRRWPALLVVTGSGLPQSRPTAPCLRSDAGVSPDGSKCRTASRMQRPPGLLCMGLFSIFWLRAPVRRARRRDERQSPRMRGARQSWAWPASPRHCEEPLRRSNPVFLLWRDWIGRPLGAPLPMSICRATLVVAPLRRLTSPAPCRRCP